MIAQIFLTIFAYFAVCSAFQDVNGDISGMRTLVVVDNTKIIATHSIFLRDLEANGYSLTYAHISSPDLVLQSYGNDVYDNIVLLGSGYDSDSFLTNEDLFSFVNRGGNVFVTLSDSSSDFIRGFAANCGVDFPKTSLAVMDHFSHNSKLDNNHLAIIVKSDSPFSAHEATFDYTGSSSIINNNHVLPSFWKHGGGDILYRGITHTIVEQQDTDDIQSAANSIDGFRNYLSIPILTGNPTSCVYSASMKCGRGSTRLISALQGRNNGRVVFAGSNEFLSNDFFASSEGNRRMGEDLAMWVFRRHGVLRWSNVTHTKSNGEIADYILHDKERPDLPISMFPDPEIDRYSLVYRIKDDVRFSIIIQEFDAEAKQWAPYVLDKNDALQLEFVKLDPYIRANLTLTDPKTGEYSTVITIPDVYGIYKFRLHYRRVGLSTLYSSTQIAVRPYKHNEYERFIPAAYPYYMSVMCMMVGFVMVMAKYSRVSERVKEGKIKPD